MPDVQGTGFDGKPAAPSPLVVGQIETVVGSCSLTRPSGDPFQIKPGDPICRGDILETTAGGKVGIRFIDGTAFSLSDSARAVVKEFGCDDTEPSALFDISRGTFAFIAGEMAKSGRLRVDTPFGSIRGRARSGGIGMLSLASLFFAALENAQGATAPPGIEDGIINIRDSSDIINAPYGIIELTIGNRTIFIDNPFVEYVVRGTSVSQLPLTPAQLLQFQVESNNVQSIASLGQGPTVGGPSGSGGLPPPEPPPFITPINIVVPPNPGGPTGGSTGGLGGSNQGPGVFIPQPPPPPPPLPPGPNEINEIFDTTGSTTHDTTSGSLPASIASLSGPSFVWSGGPLSGSQTAALTAASIPPALGSSTFDFSIVDHAVDFVTAGETLTITYQVAFSDGSTQPVVVTVFGTNDAPHLAVDPGTHQFTELSNQTGNATDRATGGTLTFTDVDLSDTHTVSKTLTSAVWDGGASLPAGLATALGNALSLTLNESTNTGSGSVDFEFKLADNNFDFLAAGETLTIKYNVSVIDSNHVSSIQEVTVIVTGTEDVPAITSGGQSGSVTEIADNAAGENSTVHHQSDTITFTDVDLSDIETSSVTSRQVTTATLANGYTLTAAQQNALLSAFTIDPATHSSVNGTGTVGWHYDISDGALDFLGDDDQLVLTFTVQVNDGHGGLASQNVVITVNGTEDVPVITSGAQSGAVKEITDDAPGENTTVHHQSDTITFTDVDLSDIETSSVTSRQVTTATLANGYTLTAAQQNALLGAFTIDPATHSSVNGTGTIIWHYDISDSALDFLGDDDQLVLTFTVQVSDGQGGTASQDVVLTVNGGISGTEDAPVITSGAQSGAVSEIADNAAGENTTVHHQSDTITFIDVDLSDIETSSVTSRQVTSATLANGYTLTAAQQDALLNAFSVEAATHSQSDGTGTVGWHYDISDGALDFLGDDDQLTLTFTVQVNDGHGGLASQNVVITVNGTEDVPVITSGAQSGAVSEIADNAAGENITVHHQSNTITFTDVDLSDGETGTVTARQVTSATLANGYTLTAAQQNALLSAFTIDPATHSSVNGTGTVGWHYDISDGALDFLGDDDQLTLTFTVQVNDGQGGIVSQNVVITVNGTEDVPVITSSAQAGAVSEIADNAAGENTTVHHQTGTVTFTDVDLSDIETSSVTARQVTGATLANGYTLTAAQQNALLSAFTIDPATHSSVNGTGTVGWHYDISDGALDFLGDDDQLTLTFTVQVNDGQGGTATQNVVITVNGTEDVQVITSGAQAGAVSEIADNAAGENITVHHQTGAVTFTDVDLSDGETGTVTARQVTTATLANGYTLTAAQQNALLSAFTIDPATHSSVNGTGLVGWHYDISDGALDFLGDDDQLTLTFTVQVNDDQGGIVSQNVVITVNGTEDVPVVTTINNSFAELPGTNNPNTDSVSGTISFTDVDLSDRPTVTAAFSGYTYVAADGVTALSLTASQQSAILKALALGPTPPNTSSGSVAWTYSVADNALDFLAQNEKVTLTYIATVNDQQGGIVTKPITVTINGTNDAPVIKYTGSFSLDQFNTQDYGAWVEQGNDSNGAVNGSPLNGEFQVAHDPATAAGNFQIRLTDLDAESDNPDTLSRTFNLVGAGNTAKVEFDYRRDIPSGQSNDQFIVFASINGGAFTQIGQIGATGNGSFVDGSYQHFTFDLSSANAINSVVLRFSVGDDVDDGDVVYVDNVKLSYATTAGPTQTINYTENSAVGILPPQITDADHNATVHSAAVTITNHQANDLLSVTGLLPAGIIASSYNAATGVLTLQGDASLADYQNALSHILFSNTSDNPSTVDRSLTITVNDGLANSNVATTTIHVAAIDDLPFATADNVITNVFSGNSFQIPNWALLANDQDLDNALSITSVSGGGATLGGSAVTTTNSFNYTATGGSLTSTVQATVTRDTNGALGSDSNNGDDILIARANGPSNLQMMGGGGNDVLIGNNGSQIMNGGAGSDTFVFKAIADSTPAAFDTIQDFTPGTDHLDFTTIPGTTNLHQMATAGEAVAANSISWFKDGAQTIVYVNTTGGPGHVDMEIHLTGSNINLSGSDILHHT